MSGTYQIHNSSLSIISRANIALAAVMMFALSAGFAQKAQAQSYTEIVLHSFSGASDGGLPNGVVLDSQGNLYGVAQYGGYMSCGVRAYQSCGLVFKLDPSGHETILHDFTGSRGDGVVPLAGVILDGQANLYGTTVAGGNLRCTLPSPWSNLNGCGTVFKLDPSGRETVLYTFSGLSGGGDGAGPYASLVEDGIGNLYGTTSYGGNGSSACTSNGQLGCGTVFKVDPSGHETVLYRFTGANGDGKTPEAALVLDAQGNVYGTTCFGGSFGFGTVFKVDPSGHETVLHSFRGVSEGMMNGDGANPLATLVFDAQGNLYGTTLAGGDDLNGISCQDLSYGCGTVFKLSPSGHETVLYRFTGTNGDGEFAASNLVFDTQGNLYGTTAYGGSGYGIAFRLDTSGHETVIYSFDANGGGAGNPGDLVQDQQGNLYGATNFGGQHLLGTVYKLSPP